jgi:hypothetical protein
MLPASDLAFLGVLADHEDTDGTIRPLTGEEGARLAGVSVKTWRRAARRRVEAKHALVLRGGSGCRPVLYRLLDAGRALVGKGTPTPCAPLSVDGSASSARPLHPTFSAGVSTEVSGGAACRSTRLDRLILAEMKLGIRCLKLAIFACKNPEHRAASAAAFLDRGCGRRMCARCAPAIRWKKTRRWLRRIAVAALATDAASFMLTLTTRRVCATEPVLRARVQKIRAALPRLRARCPELLGLVWALDWTGDEAGIALHVHGVALGDDLGAKRAALHAAWREIMGAGAVALDADGSTDVRPLATPADVEATLGYSARGFEVRDESARLAATADYLHALPGTYAQAAAAYHAVEAGNLRALAAAIHGERITGALGVCHGAAREQRAARSRDRETTAPTESGTTERPAASGAPELPPRVVVVDGAPSDEEEDERDERDERAERQEEAHEREALIVPCPLVGCGGRLVQVTEFLLPEEFLALAEAQTIPVRLRTLEAEAHRLRRERVRSARPVESCSVPESCEAKPARRSA